MVSLQTLREHPIAAANPEVASPAWNRMEGRKEACTVLKEGRKETHTSWKEEKGGGKEGRKECDADWTRPSLSQWIVGDITELERVIIMFSTL